MLVRAVGQAGAMVIRIGMEQRAAPVCLNAARPLDWGM